jgi:hypothetical protein
VLAAFVDLPSQTSSMLAKMEALAGYLNGGPLDATEAIDEARKTEGLASYARHSAKDYLQEFIWLEDGYDGIRSRMSSSDTRTELMSLVVDRAQILGGHGDAGAISTTLFSRGDAGSRVIALCLARIDPKPSHSELALSGLRESRSSFEQHQALLLAETLLPSLDADAARDLQSAISTLAGVTVRRDDPGRWVVAQRLIGKLGSKAGTAASARSQPQKPMIYVSYVHLDEPDQPRGDQIQW